MTDMAAPDHAPGYRGIKFNLDWITRPLFGIALIGLVIAALVYGAPYVALFGALAGIAGAREWHRLVGEPVFGAVFFVTSLTLLAALGATVLWPYKPYAWEILGSGAVLAGVVAALSAQRIFWHGFGPIYLGLATLALVVLRGQPHGAWIIAGMFIAIWATDTGALLTGNLVGGPRLWPAISPSKTWSGTLGGIAIAAICEAIYIKVLGGDPVAAGLFGAGVAVVSVCGDLFESWVKRVFQKKDSGGMIPGHGGVLDRIDSTLAVAPILTALVIFTHLSPMFGAHP
jgi:phosphatidate cytidylyltransferase